MQNPLESVISESEDVVTEQAVVDEIAASSILSRRLEAFKELAK
ncbi:hypothetical protein KZA77_006210 [Streptococcus constellatus]|nr:hypothetical protein [Streptococcus constellatus]EHG14830.1 hypothetical protein HMPREF9682_00235 [Streptococcus intermedius F0395]